MKKLTLKIVAGLLLSSVFSVSVANESDPADMIKYRKAVMSAMAGHNNAIKQIAAQKVPFKAQLNYHVSALHQLHGELEYIFPEGSDFGKTDAKEEIWDSPERFSVAVDKAQKGMDDFKAVADTGDLAKISAATKKLGKNSCGGCHKAFKKKKSRK